ncbi:hypothetical protein [Bosea sp. FBZP-16]|uniref:hypothetical protein n=1 Tax=Bosea sp. FBZP-16 TaxID=2065382 RepID=UPI000C31A90C|nr:hypothetical protein [Bosea sp. FBZP-16]
MNRNGNRAGSKPLGSGFPPLLIIIVEGKGGVGKSVNADAANYIFASMGCVTLTAESDTTNSIMSSIHDNVVFVNVTRPGWHTIIGKHLQRMGQPGGAGAVIFDTGARDDVHVREKLPYFVQAMEAVGGHVLVIRPITTSGSAQTNAIDFAKTTTGFGIATVFMQIRAQGRTEEHFRRWSATESLREAKQLGAVDTWIDDLGVEEADEAVALGLSFAAVAAEDFDRSHDPEAARAYFDEAKVLWFQDWLETQKMRWLPVFREALANQRAASKVTASL